MPFRMWCCWGVGTRTWRCCASLACARCQACGSRSSPRASLRPTGQHRTHASLAFGALSTSWLRQGRACSRTAPDPQQHGRWQHRQAADRYCAGPPVAACSRATWRATTATRSATWTCRCWPPLRGRALSSPPPPALTPRSDCCSSWALPLSPRLAVHDVPTFLEQLLLGHQCQLQQLCSMHRQRECFQRHTGYRAASWTHYEIFKLI